MMNPKDDNRKAALAALFARAGARMPKFTIRKKRRWTEPHQGAKEIARRRRQIEKGMLRPTEVADA
jgi:hypothetical protein